MVVYIVVRTWLPMTVEDHTGVQEVLGLNLGRHLGFFYTDNSMVGARESYWIQNAINILVGLFWWYRLITNITKSWTITYQPRALRSVME